MKHNVVPEAFLCPLEEGGDWWLYHPSERNTCGEPSLCLLSHDDLRIAEQIDDDIGALFLRRLAHWLRVSVRPAPPPSTTDWPSWYAGLDAEWKRLLAAKASIDSVESAHRAAELTELCVVHEYDRAANNAIKKYELTTLEPVRAMPALRTLELQEQNKIASYDVLTSVAHLKKLSVRDAPALKTLEFLTGLEELEELSLDSLGVRDLSPAFQLTRLKVLTVYRCPIESVAGIGALTRLEALTIGDGALTSLSGVDGLKKLQSLNVWRNPITELPPLGGLDRLDGVNVSETKVTSLEPLHAAEGLDGSVQVGGTGVALGEILRLLTAARARDLSLSVSSDYEKDATLFTRALRVEVTVVRDHADSAAEVLKGLVTAQEAAPEVIEAVAAFKAMNLALHEDARQSVNDVVRYYFAKALPKDQVSHYEL